MRNLLFAFAGLAFFCPPGSVTADADERPLAHMVYFTLKDSTPANRETMLAACNKYLSDHEGTLYYSAGELCKELNREVNVMDFDIALHVVFKNKAAHDVYQTHPRHLKFIEENKPLWAKVRVFDSYLSSPAK